MPRFSASAAGADSALPLIEIRDEPGRPFGLYSSYVEFRKAQVVASRLSTTQFLPSTFWGGSSGGGAATVILPNGVQARRVARTVALNGLLASDWQIPIGYKPHLAPSMPLEVRDGRRYILQAVLWRDLPLVAGSIFAFGIATRTAGALTVPNEAFASVNRYQFRSLGSVSGGNWCVTFAPDFTGGAGPGTIIPTGFSPDVPRLLQFEFLENFAGGGARLICSIDGQAVAAFGESELSPPPSASVAWSPSFGSEGGGGAGFDYLAKARLLVFAA
jgi:hypothetical protein